MRVTPLGIYGPFPAPGGACSGTLVQWNNSSLLLDAGCGTLARLTALLPVEELSCVVLTHLHYDHMSDVLPLIYALNFSRRKEKLPLYCPDEPEAVRSLLLNGPFDVRPQAGFALDGARISFLPGRHPVPSASVRIEHGGRVFVHTGDTNWHEGLTAFSQNADLLMADAGLTESAWTERAPHLSAALCGDLAAGAQAGSLLLTHLSPLSSPEAILREAQRRYPRAALAQEQTAVIV